MKILLATDGSEHARWGCELISHIRTRARSEVAVHLVHVTTPLPEPVMPFPDVFVEDDLLLREQVEDEHETRAAERLSACRAMLPPELEVITHHRVGRPPQEILALIDEIGAELVVLGSRGVGDTRPFLTLGGVAQKVARYAPCPVLVAREKGITNHRALVGLDSGATGDQVVNWLTGAVWLAGCTVTLAHVVEDRYLRESRMAATQFAGGTNYMDRLQETLIQGAQKFLDAEAAKLKDTAFPVDTLVLEGTPATALTDHARAGGFDLLVVGARGRHGLAHFVLGSTSEKVLRRSECSVMVVRTA
ncbi:MAG: universal stress protein [Nitrospirota bacterium]|nr:universal stress protein [Nitrospirota bacterium]